MSIYVTGDTHGEIDSKKLNGTYFKFGKTLTKNDYIIVCGDFGFIWDNSKNDKYWIKWLEKKPWTTLFCDGNHENHHLISEYPEEIWNGGKIHRISSNIIHLMRGQIYNIDNNKIFVMGGAKSTDIAYRKINVSWWEEEVPSYKECEEGFKNLENNNWTVDYIITHTGPEEILKIKTGYIYDDPTSKYLNAIMKNVNFKDWYFGHMHIDDDILNKYHFMYDRIIQIGDKENENKTLFNRFK